ncbi:MAG: hypothetical protein B6U78_01230 [Candidatus Aenigmarchaeota archaeon ex4484_224]|nr:MAG: hypothetical protein B6U78_01230 [Candidatus Aenigmarchaeota archaeon ex4484_224]
MSYTLLIQKEERKNEITKIGIDLSTIFPSIIYEQISYIAELERKRMEELEMEDYLRIYEIVRYENNLEKTNLLKREYKKYNPKRLLDQINLIFRLQDLFWDLYPKEYSTKLYQLDILNDLIEIEEGLERFEERRNILQLIDILEKTGIPYKDFVNIKTIEEKLENYDILITNDNLVVEAVINNRRYKERDKKIILVEEEWNYYLSHNLEKLSTLENVYLVKNLVEAWKKLEEIV